MVNLKENSQEESSQEESSQELYSKNGMQTKVWGPTGWVFLHCIAQNYPQEPTSEQKENYLQFFKLVGNVLPCRYCRDSYQEFIKYTLNDQVMKNRQTFTKWLYDIHNKINKKLGIKDCITFKQVTDKYESFRSKCTKSPANIKVIKGCTNPPKEGSLRMGCELKFIPIDENGKKISRVSFGEKKKEKIKLVSIKKSSKPDKKLMATFEIKGRKKVIHFGFNNNTKNDYTKHHDVKRKANYIFRHHKDLKTNDPARAGYLSMFVLWNKPSLKASITDYRRRLNIYNKTGKFPTKIPGYKSPGKKSKYQ